MFSSWLIVVPARFESTRLPGKLLMDLGGAPVINRVIERLLPLRELGARVIVATDHPEIQQAVSGAGYEVQLTSKEHQSGSDRCAEVARQSDRTYVLNVQGDEPFVSVPDLKALMTSFAQQDTYKMGTLGLRNQSYHDFLDPNCVKLVRGQNGGALYFSRSPIPHACKEGFSSFWQHVGVYAYESGFLQTFTKSAQSPLEQQERLEQLRALEMGEGILVSEANEPSFGIDTAEDLEKARGLLQR